MSSASPSRPAPRVTAAMLADVSLFADLDAATLALLATSLPTDHAEPGQLVVREGDRADQMYVIVAGELEVVKNARSGGEVRVALLGPGDWFGEMAVLDDHPRSASVRAVAPTTMVRVSDDHATTLLAARDMKSYALLMRNIARELSRRLRVADGILADFVTQLADTYARTVGTRPR